MAGEGAASPGGRSSLEDYRFEVAGATFDEPDEQKYSDGTGSDCSRGLSVASTVDVDNTHPYLVKRADIYAQDNNGDANSLSTGPSFVDVKPPSQYKEGQRVLYNAISGPSEEILTKFVYDQNVSGRENQANSSRLHTQTTTGATDENGDVPTNFVNFKTSPTHLFHTLYHGNWQDAQQRLQTHPEEARIWVARYAKKCAGASSVKDVRWQLLPLHLYIALAGRFNDAAAKPPEDDVPDDEKDKIIRKENEDANTPPMELLVSLLSAYPQATQCTDDQGMIPLHSAIRGNSSLEIIENLLVTDPSSVFRKDMRGRNAFSLMGKVFRKGNHKERAGNKRTAGEIKYVRLMNLISITARRVSSSAELQPREKAQDSQPKDGSQHIHGRGKEEAKKKIYHLHSENLALRQEIVDLRHRAEINERLLRKLVEKLQMYEEQRSINIENYNEIFGSKDEIGERRRGILLSISKDDDGSQDHEKVGEKRQTKKKQVGGDGAYHKRLERYLQSTPTRSKGNIDVVSPSSTLTEEAEEPDVTPTHRLLLLAMMESCDEDDANNNTAGVRVGNEEKISGVRKTAKVDELGSAKSPESDESSNANTKWQGIFRPHDAQHAQPDCGSSLTT